MDHRLWMYNMHYESGAGLKPEFIDDRVMVHLYCNGFKPIYFVCIDHGESDGLDGIFYNSMPVDVYNMVAPHGQIRVEQVRVEHDRAHEMINDAFGFKVGWNRNNILMKLLLKKRKRPNRNDEGDIDPLFPPISIFNQNGRGSKKCRKRGFTDMEMQSAVTHILLNCSEIQSYGNEAIYTGFSKWLRNYMSSGGDGDRHREHLGVSQTKQAKKKKSRRPIDLEDIAGSISFALEHINHDTHIFAVPFGTADPRQYYPNYRRPVGASSTSQLSAIRLGDSSSEQSDAMAAAPCATPHYTMFALAPSQKDRLGRVMIELDGSSWNPAKDAARALKECVGRLYTQAYHSWSEIPNSIRQAMFNNFKTMCTWESRYNLVIRTTFARKASARLSSWLKSIWDNGERPSWMLPRVFDELGQY
ncbi:hypothetical protein H5410_003791 [Solanum commersonii]|uniref:Uncharacterized protein n=1 Tax=Solanum commersonii TaxID=4109 RepID=A0A9J6B642_SOLCO|nr:hypothetical protein H5410_003791 [Solanum commersonii]